MKVKPPPVNNYAFRAQIDRVIDGDSFVCVTEIPFVEEENARLEVRVSGINSAEKATAQGKLDKAFAETLLAPGDWVIVTTHKPTVNQGKEKYGRWLADVMLPEISRSYADVMIEAGHAVAYNGTGPR